MGPSIKGRDEEDPKTLSSCLCGSGKRHGMVEGHSGSILGKKMMQGEATIESFPSYPRPGSSTTSFLALPFCTSML